MAHVTLWSIYYQVATCCDMATIATHCQIKCVIICIHMNIFLIKLLTDTQPGGLGADTFNYHNLWVAYWINCSKFTYLLRWLSDNGHKNLELLIHMCGLDFLKDIRFFPVLNPLEQLCVRPLHLQLWQGDVVSQRQKRVFQDLKACAW